MNYYTKIFTTFLPGEAVVSTVMGAMLGGYLGVILAEIDINTEGGKQMAIIVPMLMLGYVGVIFCYHWLALSIASKRSADILLAVVRAASVSFCFFALLIKSGWEYTYQLGSITGSWFAIYIVLGLWGTAFSSQQKTS
ncbi:membrane hypothetical protein [Vibrio crassostreae]|uniref:hypothetical protein n=1 Tax=Vibrio crassostreae TaxID=246167 RepID=UPI0006301E74|nr:hypothetical protein [Vibrio crassostreae]CAK2051610.1 membrane hypothetical protein [Vibrio crassostreae]CAK2055725.1 membrane hypothetical protein [Vibrio crassostreae]CAK2057801.1 membrane hypothetical protein [Vibrio crassostreae]CAK2061591.1 membrane hypothetical protein [Vibrio crassostreae]CAK2062433.1 membrane hypothetical protein [Vibrio crassostreae]